MSELKIDESKCQVMGINCSDKKLRRQADTVGCEVGFFPSSYLNLLLGSITKQFLFLFFWLGIYGG